MIWTRDMKTNKTVNMFLKRKMNNETLVWHLRSGLCVQVHLREQCVSESLTRTALLLSLWWGADGSVGQSEGSWWWVRRLIHMLVLQDNTELSFFWFTLILSLSRVPCFLISFFGFHQGLWWSLSQTPRSSQVSNSSYNGWGKSYFSNQTIRTATQHKIT